MPPSPAGTPTGTATILFTDLVDSTTLRTQLGEERAEAARRAHHRLLGDTIAQHRGTVHDDLGDGMMASFPGAADAVAAAVAIQQAIVAGSQRGTEAAVAIRVGISAGDVAWEDTHPRLALTGELTALAAEVGSSELARHAAVHRTGALLESGDIGGAERALVEGERLAGELRQAEYTWWARVGRTMLAVMRGAPDAEAQIFATFELGSAGGRPEAATVFSGQLNRLRHNQGRDGELAEVLRANVDAMPHWPLWRAFLARLYTETDQPGKAREQVDLLRANGFDPPLNWTWATPITALSEAVRDLDDRSAAAMLYELLRPVSRQVYVAAGMVVCGGSFGLHAGMLAACLHRWDAAERHFTDALAMDERLGARPYVVRTRRAWASMLLDRHAPGDATRARDRIAAGRAEAETLGMAREIVRFERLAARIASS